MVLVFIIILIQAAIVIPLAVHRENIRRVLLIACLLEAGKYLFAYLFAVDFLSWLPDFVIIGFFYMVFLAEWLASGGYWPVTLAGKIAVLCVGVAWNLAAAYMLALCVPGKMSSAPTSA
jgi:hypothetical protein